MKSLGLTREERLLQTGLEKAQVESLKRVRAHFLLGQLDSRKGCTWLLNDGGR